MAVDYSLPVRRVVMPKLKSDGELVLLVPVDRIYPVATPAKPALPFSRYGVSTVSPFRASGLDSSVMTFSIHAFTKALLDDAGAEVVTAEDRAHQIAAAISACLDSTSLPLEAGGRTVRLTWLGSNLLIDGDEPAAWHAVVNFRAEVSG